MIVLDPKVEQVAESVPYSRHAGKTHPCAALPVNTLERLLGKFFLVRDELMPLLLIIQVHAAISTTAQMRLYVRYQIMCHSVIPFVAIMVCW